MYFLWYLLCSLPLLSFCSSYPSLQLSFFRVLYGMVSSVSLRLLLFLITLFVFVFFFNQMTAYDVRIIDWSSDVCSSDLHSCRRVRHAAASHDAHGIEAAHARL